MLWRGRNEKTVGKLLVDLWKEEEKKFGVRRDAYGVITGTLYFSGNLTSTVRGFVFVRKNGLIL